MWSWPPTPPRSWWFAAGGAGRDIILSGHSLSLRRRQSEEDSHPAPASSTLITGGPTCHHYQTTGEPNAIIDAGGLGSSTANSGASQIEGDFVDAGDSNDLVIASHAGDTVLGGQGTDVIWGTGGGDYLSGDADGDFIHGVGSLNEHDFEHAADQLHGNDLVDGGSGINHLDGGAGNDIYTVTTSRAGVGHALARRDAGGAHQHPRQRSQRQLPNLQEPAMLPMGIEYGEQPISLPPPSPNARARLIADTQPQIS